MTTFAPFADDAASITIAKLTIENGTQQISLYGSLDITRDQTGLQHALALKAIIDQAVEVLTSDPALLERLPPLDKPTTVKNPFDWRSGLALAEPDRSCVTRSTVAC
jgi:hypothetical protein